MILYNLRELWNYRDLLRMWIAREIRIRYKQSLLGATWAILQPLTLMIVFTVVFSVVVRVPIGDVPYPIFSYTALLPWTLFSVSVTRGSSSLINNMNLVSKIYFPREILPLATIGASIIDFLIASLVYIGLMFYYHYSFHLEMLFVPILLVIQVILISGILLFLSALNVFYRDIRFVVPLLIQIWLYATPIIYPLDMVPERLQPFYMINPMAGLIDSYRAVILRGEWPNMQYLVLATVISLILFITGYIYFKKVEWQFADII